jgi:uncharacterized protein (DUF302 family)
MSLKKVAAVLVMALAASAVAASAARASLSSFSGTRVTVDSTKSYEQVIEALKALVASNGMMVMAEVNQGHMLTMTGLSLKATVFLVGNPTVGKQLFEQNQAVGLYVPLRVAVFVDSNGKTHVEYDRPSSLLAQFKNDQVTMVAKMLDEKLAGLAGMAAK